MSLIFKVLKTNEKISKPGNNAFEGMFTDLKTKLRNHPGFQKNGGKGVKFFCFGY